MSEKDRKVILDDGSDKSASEFADACTDCIRMLSHLQFNNRFFLPDTLTSILDNMLDELRVFLEYTEIGEYSILYRARLHKNNQIQPFKAEEMGAPSHNYATAGRISPDGIPCLYLADSCETAIAEVRPWKGAKVSVTGFRLLRDLKLACLRQSEFEKAINTIRDGTIPESAVHFTFSVLSSLSKPVGNENPIHYVPAQYFSSKLKHLGYEGIVYDSVMHDGGYNLALFNPNEGITQVGEVEQYDVKNVKFDFRQVC